MVWNGMEWIRLHTRTHCFMTPSLLEETRAKALPKKAVRNMMSVPSRLFSGSSCSVDGSAVSTVTNAVNVGCGGGIGSCIKQTIMFLFRYAMFMFDNLLSKGNQVTYGRV